MEKKEYGGRHVPISDIVRHAHEVEDITRAASERVHATTERDPAAFKVERFALLVFLLEKIFQEMEHTRRSRPPFGLWFEAGKIPLTEFDQSRPFITMEVAFGVTLTHFVKTVLDGLEASPVFQRYRMLTEGGIDPSGDIEGGARGIINRGVMTAVTVMAGILEVIPPVYQRATSVKKPDHKVLTDIARASYPTILKLAMLHIDNFSLIYGLLDSEERFIFDPRLFKLKRVGNSAHIILDERILEHMRRNPSEHDVPVVGCPAHVALKTEGSIIKRLWDWHVEIAEGLYQCMDHGLPVALRARVKISLK